MSNLSKQVISVSPNGEVYGLNHKKKGVQLKTLGKMAITRVTEIVFNEKAQAWTIRFLQGEFKSATFTHGHLAKLNLLPLLDHFSLRCYMRYDELKGEVGTKSNESFKDANLYFSDYEDAVKFEVRTIQAAQVSGKSHLVID